ncbi:C-C motif chemokine 14-like [Acanthochromis polyacanthus]|uniref:C-C motif chemokine 14-like n=1 Tax=Acanthochromis polyacanthus TaxID=80966 RepID=UPI002234CF10|nr:C-C motif chemokine 14-like [Acanthochromis polyacanthus]
MMMKMKIALVTCVLLVSSLALVASESSFGPQFCCFSYYEGRLRKANVMDVRLTASMCAKKGVILTMLNGLNVCVDPSVQWVKSIIEAKEKEQMEN